MDKKDNFVLVVLTLVLLQAFLFEVVRDYPVLNEKYLRDGNGFAGNTGGYTCVLSVDNYTSGGKVTVADNVYESETTSSLAEGVSWVF